MGKISEEEYKKASEIVNQWHEENPTPYELRWREIKAKQAICEHEWILDDDWGGRLEGNKHCSKCGVDDPSNYY